MDCVTVNIQIMAGLFLFHIMYMFHSIVLRNEEQQALEICQHFKSLSNMCDHKTLSCITQTSPASLGLSLF